jgi:Uma2 family endonuclease
VLGRGIVLKRNLVEGRLMATVEKRAGVQRRRWTREEYYRLGELGFFRGQRVELIEGELLVQSPQSPLHANEVDRVYWLLVRVFGAECWVRARGPTDLDQLSEPEPDVSVVAGSRADYVQAHPMTAVLIVEVSDSTLSYDRGRKASLYARAGIDDYWLVNLVDRRIEVYRDPVPDSTQHYGYGYSSRSVVVPPGTVTPLALPAVVILAADLLP